MDSTTRRKIDALRDTLVGKLPVPTQQVEQITLALLYKFMYDLDKQNEDLGGKKTFFTNGYSKYAWNNIIDKKLSGADRVAAYGEALEKMSQNAKLPQLFRSIFQRAYLPFRDPQTLNLFLQQIDDFTYVHSEDLGDAFEYLLSIMGSQGDAGQFRTPRHIIDFLVACVDPDLNMRVLDPACGTAGFLISAYKHILSKHTGDNGRAGSKLTSKQKEKLAEQFTGYDISHDMVRLSLVNMYLHNLPEPKIYEYDTLTSEDRWNERAECILANPPFMTPKGGIRPHNKFRIQAKRSEVLFVDYMLEHLTSDGRAGFIVPEGIIFQSGNAYKELRKMLVDEGYLWAVVSLPSGVFQPYSGVKTSILLIDRVAAKKHDEILFVKIENDGFDLGAQRRPIEKNDLPEALNIALHYKEHGSIPENAKVQALTASRGKIAESGDYNLSMERYSTIAKATQEQWPFITIGELVECVKDQVDPSDLHTSVPYVGLENIESDTGRISDLDADAWSGLKSAKSAFRIQDVLFGKLRPNLNKVAVATFEGICSTDILVLRSRGQILPSLFAEMMRSDRIRPLILSGLKGAQLPRVSFDFLETLSLPKPSFEVQEALVAELERYRKMIEGARAIIDNYKPEIEIDPSWEVKELGEVTTFVSSGSTPLGGKQTYLDKGILFIRSQNILSGYYDFSDAVYIAPEVHSQMTRSQVKQGDVFLNITGASIGRSAWMDLDIEANVNQHVCIIRTLKILSPSYLTCLLNSDIVQKQIFSNQSGASREALNYAQVRQLSIPVPTVEAQSAIVSRLESERAEIDSLKAMVARLEEKIKSKVAALWD